MRIKIDDFVVDVVVVVKLHLRSLSCILKFKLINFFLI